MRYLFTGLLATLCLALSGCGYNRIQTQDEAVKAAWSEVVNQYQRRADLIPNLVDTVKGYAAQEQKVLIGVTEARARATSIQVTPEVLNDPEALRKFQAAQGELTERPQEPARRRREVSGPEVGPEFPRSPGAARRHGEPHHGRAEPLHRIGAGLQRNHPAVSGQPDRDAVRLRREAELHG